MATTNLNAMKGASWFDLALAVIVLATPFFTAEPANAFWSAVIVGIVVGALAIYNLYAENQGQPGRVRGPAIVNVLAGLWLIGAAFVLSASMAYLWITGIAGLALVISAGYEVAAANQLSATTRTRTV